MAYRDMNGKVMIDEAAAQADIRQERQAEQILRRAANALQAVQNESNSFRGRRLRPSANGLSSSAARS